MNLLSRDKQVKAVAAICEDVSIRAAARLTGADRGTIMRLGVRAGIGCARLHDRTMHSLRIARIELDEAWSFAAKKQRRVTAKEAARREINTCLSQWRARKRRSSGKRDEVTTEDFLFDLRERVLGIPEISSDGFKPYLSAMRMALGHRVHYGQIIKTYNVVDLRKDAAHRYSPGVVISGRP